MKYISIITAFMILALSACDDKVTTNAKGVDDLASVDVIFKAVYGDDAFVLNEVYDYDGSQIRISNLKFFISEVSLGTNSSSTEVDDVELVDFSKITDATLAAEGLSVASSTSVPVGEYPGVTMGIGVVPDYNSETPDLFAPTHPLSISTNYWPDWNSYIFLRLEGTMDKDGDGIFDDVNFVYHVGSNETYEQVSMARVITFATDENTTVTIQLDIEKLFIKNEQYLDIEANPKIHNINQLETGHYLMDNFENALTIQ